MVGRSTETVPFSFFLHLRTPLFVPLRPGTHKLPGVRLHYVYFTWVFSLPRQLLNDTYTTSPWVCKVGGEERYGLVHQPLFIKVVLTRYQDDVHLISFLSKEKRVFWVQSLNEFLNNSFEELDSRLSHVTFLFRKVRYGLGDGLRKGGS